MKPNERRTNETFKATHTQITQSNGNIMGFCSYSLCLAAEQEMNWIFGAVNHRSSTEIVLSELVNQAVS